VDFTTLIELVSHYSPSGKEAAASTWLTSRMKQLGATRSFVDPVGNAVGIWGDGQRQIVLLGHIDTVPGEIPVRVEDNFLYGRGSVDAKGPLACYVDSAVNLGSIPGWQVVVIGAVEEERDSIGARSIVDLYHPEFLVVGEPNHWDRVALGYKGSAWLKMTHSQSQSHSASGVKTSSELLVEDWLQIKAAADQFNEGKTKLFDQILVTLSEIHSETTSSEQTASMHIGARLPMEVSPEGWYNLVRSVVNEAEITPLGYPVPAWSCEKNTPLVRAMLASIRENGGTPSFVYKTGTSDLNIVAPVWSCPALVYGPGDSSLDHTPGECLPLEEYKQAVKVLVLALRKLTAI
jgi:[amino group carrier protein]-lysine/ornithine hydrolase